jgi:hypothetical protein
MLLCEFSREFVPTDMYELAVFMGSSAITIGTYYVYKLIDDHFKKPRR